MAQKEAMYAYNFKGKLYDVGNKQGFLEAIVEHALRREDLREEFLEYLVKWSRRRQILNNCSKSTSWGYIS